MTEVADRPAARGRPRSERAAQAILDATVDVLIADGVTGLSIEAVAAAAGVAKTTVYRRWSSKNELILDALAHLKGPVVQPSGGSVRDDLVFLLERVRSTALETKADRLMPRLISHAREYPELMDAYRRRVVVPRRRVFHDVLRRGVAEGLIGPDADVELAAEMLLAPVLIRSWVDAGPRLGEGQIPALVDLVLAGLAAH